MPNHVHLVTVPQRPDCFARTFRRVHAGYARAVRMRLRRAGHLWQARYGLAPMDEKHFWAALIWKAHKAQPLAKPPETVINLEMAAT